MRFKLTDLPEKYHAQVINAVAPRLPDAKPKQNAFVQSLGQDENEGGSQGRIAVRITRCGTRLLDLDNLYGSAKYICDALRYCNIIPEDNPEAISLEVRQRKVTKEETGTLIEILYEN